MDGQFLHFILPCLIRYHQNQGSIHKYPNELQQIGYDPLKRSRFHGPISGLVHGHLESSLNDEICVEYQIIFGVEFLTVPSRFRKGWVIPLQNLHSDSLFFFDTAENKTPEII